MTEEAGMKDVAELVQRAERAEQRLIAAQREAEELEARLCPEDVGIEEYVTRLKQQLTRRRDPTRWQAKRATLERIRRVASHLQELIKRQHVEAMLAACESWLQLHPEKAPQARAEKHAQRKKRR